MIEVITIPTMNDESSNIDLFATDILNCVSIATTSDSFNIAIFTSYMPSFSKLYLIAKRY